MKTRTMKKALSLILAVLMIALAIPFTLLPISAEGEAPEIVNATIKGYFPENDRGRVIAFENARGARIYDGDVTSDVYSEAYNKKANAIKNSYFDADGKLGYEKNEAVAGGYYHVIILELNEKSTIDMLNLWADSGRNSEWACPNGYDIWYSADGETYTNSGLSFSGIRDNTQVNPEIYVNDTFKGSACIAHHIDMGGVEAKYIAIAVTDFAYGSGSGQSVLYEVTVDGTIVEDPTPKVVNATIGGWFPENDKNAKMFFQNSNPGSNIYDGKIGTDAESGAYNDKANAIKNSYFDEDGKFGFEKNEAVDGGYYHVIFLELNEWTAIDTLNLWADSKRDSTWACPNGYDIWYSVDGETYTNSGLSFSGIRNETEVNPEIYVDDTFNGSACIAHHIDMDGVVAKYIAIAVTDFAYGSGSGQSIIYEVTVNGITVDEPIISKVTINDVAIYARDGSGNPVKWGKDYSASKITDGILHEDNFASVVNQTAQITPQVYFDKTGAIAYKDNASYYGVAVVELSELAAVDTLTVWSPNGLGGEWIDNVSYDIYYSVDGVFFAPVEGATIEDSRDAFVGVDASEFPGDATVCNDAGVIYKNEIDLNGVTANYVAIAVKQPIPHSDGRAQFVFYELTVDAKPTSVNMSLINGAQVRMSSTTGIRFTGLVNKNYFDGLKTQYATNDVTLGMLITPTDYIVDNGLEFTKEALDACTAITGTKYLEIDAANMETVGNDYKVNCAIVNILSANYKRDFSAILYIKVNGEIVEYSDFNVAFNSRSVASVAEKAYADLSDVKDYEENGMTYSNEVVVADGVVKYSPYTKDQRDTLAGFFA